MKYCLSSRDSYGDATIVSEGMQSLGLCSVFMAYEQGDVYGVPYLLWRGLVQLPRFWGLYKPWWRTIHFHLAVCCFTLRWGYFAHLMTSPVRRDNFGLLWRNGLYRTTSAVTNDLRYFLSLTLSTIKMSRIFNKQEI